MYWRIELCLFCNIFVFLYLLFNPLFNSLYSTGNKAWMIIMRGRCFCSEINCEIWFGSITSKLYFMESTNDLNLATWGIHSARNDLFMAFWEAFPLFNLDFNYGRQNETFFDSMGIGSTIFFPVKNKDIFHLYFSLKKDQWTRSFRDNYIKHCFKPF